MTTQQPPRSATHGGIVFAGLIVFLLSLFTAKFYKPFETSAANALFILLGTAFFIFLLEFIFLKIHLRKSTGLDFSISNPSLKRTFIKFIGLLGSLGFIGVLYWIFPEYHGSFYSDYYAMLNYFLPYLLIFSIPYFYFIDKHQTEPQDSYYHFGLLCLLNFEKVSWAPLKSYTLGWLVKGFFLPLMFTYLVRDLNTFNQVDFSKMNGFKAYFDFLYALIFTIDVGIVSMGYMMSFRLTDSHLRSAEPTFLGWSAALVCYQPFWSLVSRQYLDYDNRINWGSWFSNSPMLFQIWGCGILFLFSIYTWASLNFGCRFSNLTHRGILTNGPYRWSKHPAYISKCMAWWLISLPFLVSESFADSVRRSLLLLMLNGIYLVRAVTEERHLSKDPVYVEYADWISLNGLFARLRGFLFFR